MANWKLEDSVNDWVKAELRKKDLEFWVESIMSDFMKESLANASKTQNKTATWKPDFNIEKYEIPVIIEDKLRSEKLIATNNDGSIKSDDKSITAFAVNWAVWYATKMIGSGKYNEVIAIGVAGDNEENVEVSVHYVYGSGFETVKAMPTFKNFSFLENKETFARFYEEAQLTTGEKHKILVNSKTNLGNHAKKLNKMLHLHDISVAERVLYVSGMLLSMQNVFDDEGNLKIRGLTVEDLNGFASDGERDGQIILRKISSFLKERNIPEDKTKVMLNSFNIIAFNPQRDIPVKLDAEVSKLLKNQSSINK